MFRFNLTRASRLPTRALTLVEMLVSMAITLVMMAAVVTLFANVGQSVSNRRAIIEISGTLRMARMRLQKDLAGATCDGIPKSNPGDNEKADGYIEIVEGQWSDKNPSLLTDGTDNGDTSTNPELNYATSLVPSGGDPEIVPPPIVTSGAVTNGRGLGDYDDILALTVRSEDEPFVGRGLVPNPVGGGWVPGTIESNEAEVIWYAVENPADGSLGEPGMRTIYRRMLLIAPWADLSGSPAPAGITTNAYKLFYDNNDISVHIEGSPGSYVWVPNTLADLIKRENRFTHDPVLFPHVIDQSYIRFAGTTGPLHPFGPPFDVASEERQGEDVMLSDVLAFDVRVYDPDAPLRDLGGVVLEPSDKGWDAASTTPVGIGAYVDLSYLDESPTISGPPLPSSASATTSRFSSQPSNYGASGLRNLPFVRGAYDTWSFHYENDGIDQGGLGTAPDEATNGLDDDGNGSDDIGERETFPPYNVPLRGIQVKLRVYERDSRNIRETSVIQSFN